MLQPGTFGLTLLLAMLTALGPLSMDMYLPSLPDIAHVLDAPVARTQLTISSYLIGFAVGQMIYGPLSDRYGRRPVLLAAVALYLASTLACAAAQSVDLLIAARLLQGISGSGAIVLARAIVRDVYSGVQAARELSLMGSISATAPIVAPMIGGVLQAGFGWRANFFCMSVGGLIALLVAGRLLPETLRPDNRAESLVGLLDDARLRRSGAPSRVSRLSGHHHHHICGAVRVGLGRLGGVAGRLWSVRRYVRFHVRPGRGRLHARRHARHTACGPSRPGPHDRLSALWSLRPAGFRWRSRSRPAFRGFGWWRPWRSILRASVLRCRRPWPVL